jgi:hypothetical protein
MTAFHPTTNGIPPIRQPATENFAIGFFLANCAVDALRTAQDVRVLNRAFVQGVPDGTGCADVTAGTRARPVPTLPHHRIDP